MENVIDLQAWREVREAGETTGDLERLFKDLEDAEAAIENLRTVIKDKLGVA